MVVCIVIFVVLLMALLVNKKSNLFGKIREKEKKKIFLILFASNMVAAIMFGAEILQIFPVGQMNRNSYGEGNKKEYYEATVEGELEREPIEIEVQERAYTHEEIQEIFKKMRQDLDEIVLGDNKSYDRVEKDLNLVDSLEEYPVLIQWELDNYKILNPDGKINQEATEEKGTLVEIKAILSYGDEKEIYITHAKIYPETKEGREKWVDAINKSIQEKEETTREEEGFLLPNQVLGKEIQWNKKKDARGYYILAFGVVISGLLIWKNRQEEKERRQKEKEQMIRDYPDIISKFTLLLSTGMTVKAVWAKIVQGYEEDKEKRGKRYAYEEMKLTYHEMQSGIPEMEAYERFGKRCKPLLYTKFGALLSQNLKKGGKGLAALLKVESIQAFENRKSMARRTGEEAATKLLIPMFGMLAVVMVIIIIPAFLSIQI